MSKKTSVIIIAAIVVLAVLGLWVLNNSKMFKNNSQTDQPITQPIKQENTAALPFEKNETAQDKLPDGFVKGFPVETGAVIQNNYSAQTAAGLQSSRRFVSARTLEENYKIYNDYFTKNKWKILTFVNTEAFKSISAKSAAGVEATVSISVNSVTQKVEVDIAFLQPNK